ncbi:beta strand repeat-containing protein [Macellibacteroides fermentans]|uniref:beta strand repeat-containing protein n=1 Tax=Macellibacteroides fermentans TaxID=879969 RepID=UPI00406CC03B
MKKRILNISTLVAVFAFASTSVHAQQGFGTNQPSKAAAIEMKSDSKGLLIPRVTLTDLTNFGPIQGGTTVTVAHANSLLVYNTATATNLTPGYYYWTATSTVSTADGTVGTWKRLMANDDITALTLNGDVTGSLTANTVAKIQGRDVLNTAPTNNQVLTWNGTAWAPATITPAQIGNKAALTTQDGIAITAGTGTDALLAAATIGITDGGIAPVKIQPAQGTLTNRMVMVTQTDGTVTWIPQTDIAPTTTNVLSLTGNALKSTVNGVESSVNLTDANITSDKGITSNTINLTGATGATLTDVTMEIKPGNANEVLITNATGEGVSWVNQSVIVPTTTNALSSSANTMTSNVNGISDDATIINSNTLELTGNDLVSTVNGIASAPAVDLSKYLDNTDAQTLSNFRINGTNLEITIENGNTVSVPVADLVAAINTDNQTITNLSLTGNTLSVTLERGNTQTVDLAALTNTTNLDNGTNTTVSGTGAAGTPYTVSVATANSTTLGVVRQADTAPSVTVTNGVLAVNPANVTISNALSSSVNTMSSTVNGGTAQTAPIINSNALSLNGTNQLVSTVNGVASTPALNLAPAITAGETLTSLTQSSTTGEITYQRERSANQTVNVLSTAANNLITYSTNGVFLNAATIKSNQENTIVSGTAPVTVGTPTTAGNNKTYTIAVNNATAAAVGVVKPGTGLTVAIDGTLNAQASNGYSTTEYLTGKKWTNDAPVYETVFTVTIATNEANSIIVPGTTKPAKILSMRMISQTDNSITTEVSRYDAATGTLVFGSGRTTQYQKVGTYDLILEYIK